MQASVCQQPRFPRKGGHQTLEQGGLWAVNGCCHAEAILQVGVQGTARLALTDGQRHDLPRAAPAEAVPTAAVAVAVDDPEGPGWRPGDTDGFCLEPHVSVAAGPQPYPVVEEDGARVCRVRELTRETPRNTAVSSK